jgi:hypothetical protein
MHPIFERLAHNPEPALNAEHPAPFAPGSAPHSWKNAPKDKSATVHATHTEAHGIEITTPEQYIEQTVKPIGGK